ncbi:MAG TPA: uracil phosphoribosyltransferase, partial [Cyanothece sp. UBA12306]|nr:uracil phosphoribosyltransferase [Cyanothece sp. UBA12306]
NKLPQEFKPQTQIIVLEPMLATGSSIMVAMEEITKRGGDPALMRIISVVAAPPALQKLSQAYPSLNIYTAIIDEGINSKGYIVPGLGDAGDRSFGT